MGGNAFAAILGPSAFPRMPPAVYDALKRQMVPKLQELYLHVAVPLEAPEKTSHGDLDIVVAGPKIDVDFAAHEGADAAMNVPHVVVQEAIGARYVNPLQGNRTSNFAVPIARGGWGPFDHAQEEDVARRAMEGEDIFYQVDVNVCTDKEEFERRMFFHAYGDLGMIMGLIGRNAGLALGEKGLRISDPPNPPIELSRSFDEITDFMGWSMDAWRTGFRRKRDIFEWAGSSHFFNPRKFRTHGVGISKVKEERKMYMEFVQWASEKAAAFFPVEEDESKVTKEEHWVAFRDRTLAHFNKKEKFDAINDERVRRVHLKQVFSGSRVRDWAELGEHWKGVKMIMDVVREKYGGDGGILELYNGGGEQAVKSVVLEAKEQLGLLSNDDYQRHAEVKLAKAADKLTTGVQS